MADDGSFTVGSGETGKSRTLESEALCLRRGIATGRQLCNLFIRHGDGTWDVFPPDAERPAMSMLMCGAIGIFAHVTDRRSRL